jgi:hypothetical protein
MYVCPSISQPFLGAYHYCPYSQKKRCEWYNIFVRSTRDKYYLNDLYVQREYAQSSYHSNGNRSRINHMNTSGIRFIYGSKTGNYVYRLHHEVRMGTLHGVEVKRRYNAIIVSRYE